MEETEVKRVNKVGKGLKKHFQNKLKNEFKKLHKNRAETERSTS